MDSWVKLRHDCSPFEVFTKLRAGAEDDVKTRNELRKPDQQVSFKVVTNGSDRFSVLREGPPGRCASVDFKWDEIGITVQSQLSQHSNRYSSDLVRATLTLDDDAECKLKIGDKELTPWQFRRRVLEDLLFNF